MRYRFEGFEFDPRSGLLDSPGESSEEPEYLAPQPARLLELLLERAPELVTKEEISERLWPDVEVEVEQGLHHCIRQIRRVLGDSAAEERFIRTVHRRGYAFTAPVDITVDAEPRRSASESPIRAGRIVPVVGLVAILAALAIGLSSFLFQSTPESENEQKIRVAVMSFRPPHPGDRIPTIAERLVIRLTGAGESPYDIVGPSTTERFESEENPLTRVADDLDVEYVLNGRFVPDSSGFVLAEVIRASDGAHVWAEYLDLSQPDSILAERIEQAFRSRSDSGR